MPTYKTSRWTSLLDEIIPTLLDPNSWTYRRLILVTNQVVHPLNFAKKNCRQNQRQKKLSRFFVEAFSFRAGGFFQNNSSILPAFIELLGSLRRKTRGVFGVVLELGFFWSQVTVVSLGSGVEYSHRWGGGPNLPDEFGEMG